MNEESKPIKYYSDLHKAFLPDLNRCPSCGEILSVGDSGTLCCVNINCNIETVGKINKKAMKLYFKE